MQLIFYLLDQPGQHLQIVQRPMNKCAASTSNYRPPTKLPGGNAFSRVCLSTGGEYHMTTTHDALNLIIQGPPRSCSNLFDLDLTVQDPLPFQPWPPPTTPSPAQGSPILLASRRFASYWNAFLLRIFKARLLTHCEIPCQCPGVLKYTEVRPSKSTIANKYFHC